jgi:hypothetical protein
MHGSPTKRKICDVFSKTSIFYTWAPQYISDYARKFVMRDPMAMG